jgi:large subunit ribosomal protein L25
LGRSKGKAFTGTFDCFTVLYSSAIPAEEVTVDILTLKARSRSGTGKSYTRKARLSGWIPAVYYGRRQTPRKIEVDAREFAGLDRQHKLMHLINLGLPEEKGESVAIIKEIQRNVLKKELVLHIDFQHVAMDENVSVECPVELMGTPVGVLEEEGVLGQAMRHVSIECLPTNIPEKITVDVSQLHIGDTINIRDITVPNATIKDSPDEVVAVVTHATKEAVVEAPAVEGEAVVEGEAAAEGAAVEGEGKEGAAEGKAKEGAAEGKGKEKAAEGRAESREGAREEKKKPAADKGAKPGKDKK